MLVGELDQWFFEQEVTAFLHGGTLVKGSIVSLKCHHLGSQVPLGYSANFSCNAIK